MEIHEDIKQLPDFKNAVVTFGSFDGVHHGHSELIQRMKSLSAKVDGETVVVTFHPHPRQVIYPGDRSLKLLSSKEEKILLFEKLKIDHLVFCPFTVEFSQISADEYISKFIIGRFHPRYIVIGYDHRFGRNRSGNIDFLRSFEKDAGFTVIELEKQMTEQIQVSSTKIRSYLAQGDIKTANNLLGHPYLIHGFVIKGHQIGEKLGYPTANLRITNDLKLIPPEGIYAVEVLSRGRKYEGMLYIGTRPTVTQRGVRSIEVNIFDFREDIYGEEIYICLLEFMRGDKAFESLEALRLQLDQDKRDVTSYLQKRESQKDSAAVVILNYNGLQHLQKFIPTVLRFTQIPVVVADNASTDGSLTWLQAEHPEVKTISLDKNHGFAEGYNRALKDVDAGYVVLLNSDVEVTNNWLDPILTYMRSHPEVAACQPKILSFKNRRSFEYAGAGGGLLDSLGYPFCQGRILSELEDDQGQYDQIKEIFWASGAAMVLRKNVFKDLGGFDGDFFAHMEEIDLCWRMKRAGYKIAVFPESVVYHVGGGTLSYSSPRKTYLNFRNGMSILLKNEKGLRLLWLFPLRIMLDLVAMLHFMAVGEKGNARAVSRALGYSLINFGRTWMKRKRDLLIIRRKASGPDNTQSGRYVGSIVWEYFILRRKKFGNLSKISSHSI